MQFGFGCEMQDDYLTIFNCWYDKVRGVEDYLT